MAQLVRFVAGWAAVKWLRDQHFVHFNALLMSGLLLSESIKTVV
jgi:hypothetical protein